MIQFPAIKCEQSDIHRVYGNSSEGNDLPSLFSLASFQPQMGSWLIGSTPAVEGRVMRGKGVDS